MKSHISLFSIIALYSLTTLNAITQEEIDAAYVEIIRIPKVYQLNKKECISTLLLGENITAQICNKTITKQLHAGGISVFNNLMVETDASLEQSAIFRNSTIKKNIYSSAGILFLENTTVKGKVWFTSPYKKEQTLVLDNSIVEGNIFFNKNNNGLVICSGTSKIDKRAVIRGIIKKEKLRTFNHRNSTLPLFPN